MSSHVAGQADINGWGGLGECVQCIQYRRVSAYMRSGRGTGKCTAVLSQKFGEVGGGGKWWWWWMGIVFFCLSGQNNLAGLVVLQPR